MTGSGRLPPHYVRRIEEEKAKQDAPTSLKDRIRNLKRLGKADDCWELNGLRALFKDGRVDKYLRELEWESRSREPGEDDT